MRRINEEGVSSDEDTEQRKKTFCLIRFINSKMPLAKNYVPRTDFIKSYVVCRLSRQGTRAANQFLREFFSFSVVFVLVLVFVVFFEHAIPLLSAYRLFSFTKNTHFRNSRLFGNFPADFYSFFRVVFRSTCS